MNSSKRRVLAAAVVLAGAGGVATAQAVAGPSQADAVSAQQSAEIVVYRSPG